MTTADDRYARQRLIDEWDQERLTKATVVVVGVGALGTSVAQSLALAGVGRLLLCDPDIVDRTNLSRTPLFTSDDVGSLKVDVAAHALRRLAPEVVVEARAGLLTAGVGLGELADAELVIGCLDSIRARMQLLGRSALVGTPLVDGGTGPWNGEVRARLDPDEPCYGCSLSAVQRGASDLPRSCAELHPTGQEPASVATTALVASWQTTTAIRLLLGLSIGYRALRIDATAGVTEPMTFALDPSCPFHAPLPAVHQTITVTHRDRVRDLIAALPAGSDPLGWTDFPVGWACPTCRTPMSPKPAPAGAVECPGCGRPVVPRVGTHLADADPDLSLGDLGVAPEEILAVHDAEGTIRMLRLAA